MKVRQLLSVGTGRQMSGSTLCKCCWTMSLTAGAKVEGLAESKYELEPAVLHCCLQSFGTVWGTPIRHFSANAQ